MLTPLLLIEPHSTFVVGIANLTLALGVADGAEDVLVPSDDQPGDRWKEFVQVMSIPVPR